MFKLRHCISDILGRVVCVSSCRGIFTYPRDSVYHVTKHCLETYCDSLRLEMTKFGVHVSVILPGHYGLATACQDSIQVRNERLKKVPSNRCVKQRFRLECAFAQSDQNHRWVQFK